MKKTVFVGLSGGVDSAVSAALLKKQGYEVVGVFMRTWHPDFLTCNEEEERHDAMRVAARLDIPFLTFDFADIYKKEVADYMIAEYKTGKTPNPDVMCNKEIKFGIFLQRALEMGFDFIATGHYVRAEGAEATHLARVLTLSMGAPTPTCNPSSLVSLFSARDMSKDQSYFLWTLNQDQLRHSLFPVGNYLKSEVREIAKKFGLPNADKKDSQGLCFVGKVDFAEFIRGALPKNPGPVIDIFGKKIGEHDGAHFYTLGQRHGLNIGGSPEPLYIAEKRTGTNTLVVARGDLDPILYRKELVAENINWLSGASPELPFSYLARIRYRQPLQSCTLYVVRHTLRVVFDVPQRAVSPGQSVVFYAKTGEMLGGGVIK